MENTPVKLLVNPRFSWLMGTLVIKYVIGVQRGRFIWACNCIECSSSAEQGTYTRGHLFFVCNVNRCDLHRLPLRAVQFVNLLFII